jgi:hypothetical protein
VKQEPVARCFRSERHAATRENVRGCATQWRHENVPECQTPDARQCWPQDVRAASPWKADKHGEPREQEGCADAEQTHDAEQNETDRQRSVSPGSPHVFIVRRTGTRLRSTDSVSGRGACHRLPGYCDGHHPAFPPMFQAHANDYWRGGAIRARPAHQLRPLIVRARAVCVSVRPPGGADGTTLGCRPSLHPSVP